MNEEESNPWIPSKPILVSPSGTPDPSIIAMETPDITTPNKLFSSPFENITTLKFERNIEDNPFREPSDSTSILPTFLEKSLNNDDDNDDNN